jgi:cell division transport system ATP-binding protein
VLRDVSFDIASGSFRFLTGPSGAGKTSLLRLLFLALRPTRGLISLFGRDTATLPRGELPNMRRRIGVVFQEFRLLDHLTTFENVALPLRVTGERYAKYRDNVMELLDWVGLADHANAYPPVLSGGEKQRVAIARAVIGKPDLLLADEPTGNVDPALAIRLVKLLVELHRFGTTVLIATHDKTLIEQTRAPVLTLDRGTVRLPA